MNKCFKFNDIITTIASYLNCFRGKQYLFIHTGSTLYTCNTLILETVYHNTVPEPIRATKIAIGHRSVTDQFPVRHRSVKPIH